MNRTHCSFERRVVEPLVRRGHRVVLFVVPDAPPPSAAAAPIADDALTTAMERLRREHGVAYEIASAPPDAPDATCATILQERASPSTRSARGEPVHRALAFLRLLRARQLADAMRREHERRRGIEFGWVVSARMDVAFADDVPVDRMCAVPGGRRVHVPWFHSRGGANDRFMMGPPEGAEEYLSMYDALCERPTGGKSEGGEGAGGEKKTKRSRRGKAAAAAAAASPSVSSVPRGLDSSERLYAWYLRRRHVAVDAWALFHFVFYRVPPFSEDGVDESPDAQFARSAFNPSTSRWTEVTEEMERCPAALERDGGGGRRAAREGSKAEGGGSNLASDSFYDDDEAASRGDRGSRRTRDGSAFL